MVHSQDVAPMMGKVTIMICSLLACGDSFGAIVGTQELCRWSRRRSRDSQLRSQRRPSHPKGSPKPVLSSTSEIQESVKLGLMLLWVVAILSILQVRRSETWQFQQRKALRRLTLLTLLNISNVNDKENMMLSPSAALWMLNTCVFTTLYHMTALMFVFDVNWDNWDGNG